VRLFCVYAVLCVQVATLRRAESSRLWKDQETEKVAKVQQKGCRAIDR
jgi:hypothetical protein